jgi:hypothetical protein
MHCWAAILLALTTAPASAGEWKLIVDQDRISGYTRPVPGSRVLEVRSIAVVDAPIEVVGAVFRDIEGLKRPGSPCYESRYLEVPDRDHFTFYAAFSMPLPFHDRVVVVSVENRYDLERGRVISDRKAVANPSVVVPSQSVLIREMQGHLIVEYLGREKTGVIDTSRVDPAGNIPAFIVNTAARRSVVDGTRDLRKAVLMPEYRKAAESSPDRALADQLVANRAGMERVFANRLSELIGDRALVARLAAEPALLRSFQSGDGQVGEVLLRTWGSDAKRKEGIALLLRSLLAAHGAGPAAINRFLTDALLEKILAGRGGDEEVDAFMEWTAQAK